MNEGKPVSSLLETLFEWNDVTLLDLSDMFLVANVGVRISVCRGTVSEVGFDFGEKVESWNDV